MSAFVLEIWYELPSNICQDSLYIFYIFPDPRAEFLIRARFGRIQIRIRFLKTRILLYRMIESGYIKL